MGYDGERPIIEIPVMLTEYELQVLLRWYSKLATPSAFEKDFSERLKTYIPQEEFLNEF